MTRFALFLVLALLLSGLLALSQNEPEQVQVETSPATTSTTAWPTETLPTLPASFDQYVKGATKPPAPKPRPRARARTAPTAAKHGMTYPTDVLLHDLALCETGGTMDQRATSKTGRYLSYFQRSMTTWHQAGGSGDPRDHSYAEQVPIVRSWILRTGWHSQFPRCSNVIGVSG